MPGSKQNLKKKCLRCVWHLAFPMLFGGSDSAPLPGGQVQREGGGGYVVAAKFIHSLMFWQLYPCLGCVQETWSLYQL